MLNPMCGDGSTADPMLDPRDVEYNLSLHDCALTWRPVSNVFKYSSFDVFAIGSDDDPPVGVVATSVIL